MAGPGRIPVSPQPRLEPCVLTCLRAFVGEIIGVAIGRVSDGRQPGFGPSQNEDDLVDVK